MSVHKCGNIFQPCSSFLNGQLCPQLQVECFIPIIPQSSKKGGRQSKVKNPPVNYWVEVWVKREWITVDVVHGKVNCPTAEMEERADKPMLYVIGESAVSQP